MSSTLQSYVFMGKNYSDNWHSIKNTHITLQLCNKVQEFISKMSEEPEDFTGRIIFKSMFNDMSWGSKDNKQECELSAPLVSIYAEDVHQEDGHSQELDQS